MQNQLSPALLQETHVNSNVKMCQIGWVVLIESPSVCETGSASSLAWCYTLTSTITRNLSPRIASTSRGRTWPQTCRCSISVNLSCHKSRWSPTPISEKLWVWMPAVYGISFICFKASGIQITPGWTPSKMCQHRTVLSCETVNTKRQVANK